MKKLSLLKKIRLAFMAEGWLVKLMVMVYPLFMFAMVFDDESGFIKGMGIACYGIILGSMSFAYTASPTSNLKMYKTMPMRTADIIDIMSAHTLLGAIIIYVPQAILLPLAGNADMLPYFLCTDFVCLAITSTSVIWYANDKYAYAQAKDRTGDEAEVKKYTRRSIFRGLAYMLGSAIIGFMILWQGVTAPDLSADAPWLIAVFAIGLVIYTAVALGARKIKNAFIY